MPGMVADRQSVLEENQTPHQNRSAPFDIGRCGYFSTRLARTTMRERYSPLA